MNKILAKIILGVLFAAPSLVAASPSNWTITDYLGVNTLTPSTTIPVLVNDSFYASANSYLSGNVEMGASATTTGIHYVGGLGINNDYISDITGVGLTVNGGALQTAQDITVASSPTFAGLSLTGLLQGSVLFAASGGVIAQDNSNFYWDSINKYLGIGTTTPAAKLDIAQGDIILDNNFALQTRSNGGAAGATLYKDTGNTVIVRNSTGAGIAFYTAATDRMRLTGDGNLGMGTSTPAYLLDVDGDLRVGIQGNNANTLFVDTANSSVGIGSSNLGVSLPSGWNNIIGSRRLQITSDGSSSDAGLFLRRGDAFNVGIDLWMDSNTANTYLDSRYNSNDATMLFRMKTNGAPVSGLAITGAGNVGIGTTTPSSLLHVNSGAAATTTVEFGDQYSTGSNVCYNTKNTAGQAISFYFDASNNLVTENNRCR